MPLKASTVDDLEFGVNEITGTIALDERKAVFFSVAYSDGWSATVDGEPAQIYRANTGFMALDVDEGFHDIRLTYWTPGLTLGLLLDLRGRGDGRRIDCFLSASCVSTRH